MLTHVAGEFIMNMGRTLMFLSEQKPLNMTPEVRCVIHPLYKLMNLSDYGVIISGTYSSYAI